MWWDFFADRNVTERWKHIDWCLNTYDEPTIEEWQAALVEVGYTEEAARARVNAQQKFFGYTTDAAKVPAVEKGIF